MNPDDLPYQMRGKFVVSVTGCWDWTAAKGTRGYPIVTVDRKAHRAHRVAYAALVGPIPTGLVLDHLCRNHGCINPDHLEAVTQAENVARGQRPNRDLCGNGLHPWPQSAEFYVSRGPRCGDCRKEALLRKRRAA